MEEVFAERGPGFDEASERELARIKKTDELINQLLDELENQNLTKKQLADSLDLNPAFIRKLFSQSGGNPTLKTLMSVSSELGYELKLVKSS
jgi:DNA-binding phage protein